MYPLVIHYVIRDIAVVTFSPCLAILIEYRITNARPCSRYLYEFEYLAGILYCFEGIEFMRVPLINVGINQKMS